MLSDTPARVVPWYYPRVPLTATLRDGVLHTILTGVVTDAELVEYYTHLSSPPPAPWTELVDGTAMTRMEFTPAGYRQLRQLFGSKYADVLWGGRVAMLAATDAAFGMFRMWELQREDLNYTVRVFRDRAEALAWLQGQA